MDYKKLQINFERELLLQIVISMREKKLDKKGAKKVAKAFMPAMASIDEAAFIEKTARLCEFYPEILEAFLKTIKEYDEELKTKNLKLTREGIRKSSEFSREAPGIVHARLEEQFLEDVNGSKTQKFRQEPLTEGGEEYGSN